MKCKKILSAVLASAMLVSMSVSAFAADTNVTEADPNASVNMDGTIVTPPIKVTVSDTASAKVVLNPYSLTVKADNTVDEAGTEASPQIIAPVVYISNNGLTNINVSATVTGTIAGGSDTKTLAKFTTTPVAANATTHTKSAFMYLEMKPSTDASTEPTWAAAYDSKAASQQVIGATESKAKVFVTLAKSGGDTGSAFAAARITGSTDTLDTNPWTADDKISVAIKFSFAATNTAPTAV